jgi:hypothetical protein
MPISLPERRGSAAVPRGEEHETIAVLRIVDDGIPGGANGEKAAAILSPLRIIEPEGFSSCWAHIPNPRLLGVLFVPDELESDAFVPFRSGCRAARRGRSSVL